MKFKIKTKHLFWVILVLYVVMQLSIAVRLQVLPAPLFGGDYYRERGYIESTLQGYAVWEDGYYLHELQYYNYFYIAVASLIIYIFKFNVDKFMILFPIAMAALMLYVQYKLSELLFKKRYAQIIYLLTVIGFHIYLGVKGGTFAKEIFLLAGLYFIMRYELAAADEKKKKDLICSGVLAGIAGIIHGSSFQIVMGFFAAYMIVKLIWGFPASDGGKGKKESKTVPFHVRVWLLAKEYYLIFVIPVVLYLTYLAPLLLRYGREMPNPVMQYGNVYITYLGWGWLANTIFRLFFNSSNMFIEAISFISLLGFGVAVLNIRKKRFQILVTFFIANIMLIGHHLITKPLFNFWVVPEKTNFFLFFTQIFFVLFFVGIEAMLDKKAKKVFNYAMWAVVAFLLLFTLSQYKSYTESKWMQLGMDPSADNNLVNDYLKIGEYLKQNLGKDETILAHDETSFALSAVSGKKVVAVRRTHASYFIDTDERVKDAALIMYSDDIKLQKMLLDKYFVKYYFVEPHLLTSMHMLTHPRFEEELKANSINYTKARVPLDPAQGYDTGYVTEMLVIPPQDGSVNLDALFEVEQQFNVGGGNALLLRYKE